MTDKELKFSGIYATGRWRRGTEFKELEGRLRENGYQGTIELITQQNEAAFMAQSAYKILQDSGRLPTGIKDRILFAEMGRDSAQFLVTDSAGNITGVYFTSGFPKDETKTTYQDKTETLEKIAAEQGEFLKTCVLVGSPYYMLEKTNGDLVNKQGEPIGDPVYGQQFSDKRFDFLFGQLPDIQFHVIRNIMVGDQLRKVSWGACLPDKFIDLGSGSAKMTLAATGEQLANEQLPETIEEIALMLIKMSIV